MERPRPILYARAEANVRRWLRAGWLDEVRTLLARGVSPDLPAMAAIGYRTLAETAAGRLTADEAETRILRDTRRYVKRQLTWFKADTRIQWLDAERLNLEKGDVPQNVKMTFFCD